jgi:hypothetical protein
MIMSPDLRIPVRVHRESNNDLIWFGEMSKQFYFPPHLGVSWLMKPDISGRNAGHHSRIHF